jgi:hypothetical protein
MCQPPERGPQRREPETGGGHAVPGQPAPGRARPEPAGGRVPGPPPPGHDRGQPRLLDPQRRGEQVGWGPVMLPAQQEPVDVPLGQPDCPGIGAARRPAGREWWCQ